MQNLQGRAAEREFQSTNPVSKSASVKAMQAESMIEFLNRETLHTQVVSSQQSKASSQRLFVRTKFCSKIYHTFVQRGIRRFDDSEMLLMMLITCHCTKLRKNGRSSPRLALDLPCRTAFTTLTLPRRRFASRRESFMHDIHCYGHMRPLSCFRSGNLLFREFWQLLADFSPRLLALG